MTPLLAATKNGKEMCAVVLLENGSSPDIVDPQTLMNVKELAENGSLESLVQNITIRNPRTQSRCTFPRQPDDDDMRSAMGSRKGSVVTPKKPSKPVANQPIIDENRTKGTRSPMLSKRTEKHGKLESGGQKIPKKNIGNLLNVENRNSFLPRTPSPRPPSECSSVMSETKSVYFRAEAKSPRNPYDLRDLSSVLSLYGEQQAPTFRKGFSTPVMSTEDFQEYLETIKPQFSHTPRSSLTRSSTSSLVLSPFLQQRRSSVLLKDYNLRKSVGSDSRTARRSYTISHAITQKRRNKSLERNLSDPFMDENLPVRTRTSRRHSLAVTTQLYKENGTRLF